MGAPTNAAGSRLTSVAGIPGALYWLALGTFAIGTEGFMIAALLVPIASDLRVSVAQAGLLVSIFALAYATSSPVLTVLTGRLDRRRLLIASMSLFAFLNIGAAMAHSFLALAAARVLLAFAAGLYTPNANALAGAVVSPEHRGRGNCDCQRWVDGGDCSGRAARCIRWRSAWLAHDLRGCRCAFGHRVRRAQPGTAARRRCRAGLNVARGPRPHRAKSVCRANPGCDDGLGERLVRGLHVSGSASLRHDVTPRPADWSGEVFLSFTSMRAISDSSALRASWLRSRCCS